MNKKWWLVLILLVVIAGAGLWFWPLKKYGTKPASIVSTEPSRLGFWKLEKQLEWDEKTQKWIGGIILADGTRTDTLLVPVFEQFKNDESDCETDIGTGEIEHLKNYSCAKSVGHFDVSVTPKVPVSPGSSEGIPEAIMVSRWEMVNGKLERTALLTWWDLEPHQVSPQIKTIWGRSTKEEALKGGYVEPKEE